MCALIFLVSCDPAGMVCGWCAPAREASGVPPVDAAIAGAGPPPAVAVDARPTAKGRGEAAWRPASRSPRSFDDTEADVDARVSRKTRRAWSDPVPGYTSATTTIVTARSV